MNKLILIAASVLSSATARASTWQEPYTYDLIEYIDAADCDASGCDLDDAFAAVIDSCEAEMSAPGLSWNRKKSGCTINVPSGDHVMNETLGFCRDYVIKGAGGRHRAPMTKISVTKTPFHARSFGSCQDSGEDFGGAITIKGIGLVAPHGPHAEPIVAIVAEAPVTVIDVWAIYFDVTLTIRADVNWTPKSNANVFYVNRLSSEYTNHAGIIIEGGDTNAGTLSSISVGTACGGVTPALTAEFGECAGLWESSFLGSFVSDAHFANTSGYPGFVFDGASNRGICTGCYVENGSPVILANWSTWIGGIGSLPAGKGLRVEGPMISGIRVRNSLDPSNVVDFEAGNQTHIGGVFYSLRHFGNGTGWPLRMRWVPAVEEYLEDIGNGPYGWIRSILGYHVGNAQDLGQTIHYDDVTPQNCDMHNACCSSEDL